MKSAALTLGVIIVVLLALNVGGRYQYVQLSDYPGRFDRWTGRVEMIGCDATPQAKQQWGPSLSPYATKPPIKNSTP